ncbi:probable aspartic proteinase GIP2 [Gastrolobium bilobum]|uniref:probable aspartic proteinase GIP2 n=1 Tax=Gastrolobium bilobum TaxID=150636 RepID=UPI002AB2FE7E|nr:probable aspartic proteinase GIP2 [Gastrolobium bilobum]
MAIASIFLFFYTLLTFISPSTANTSYHPKALVLPVTRDSVTCQYVTLLHQRTPLVPIKLTLDLSGQFLWVDCEEGYVSTTYHPAHCHTSQCNITGSKFCRDCFLSRPGCNYNTCSLFPNNILTHINEVGEVALDVVSIHSTDGSNPRKMVTIPNFLFTCGHTDLLKGLASGVKGMAGFGRNEISVPSLFASAFGFHIKFTICLSSSTTSSGVLFFGDGPYVFLPGIDVSKSLTYTPLIKNPDNSAGPIFHARLGAEYFIGVKAIRINEKPIPLNTSLLSIGDEGEGGTKISTLNPYTVMETSIYHAFVNAFAKELADVPKVKPVAPFELCFNSKSLGSTRVGPAVPSIDFVLQSKDVLWRIFGANSMVQVSNEVSCLAFVDGGVEATTSIVIGGHQLEDNLLQFDLTNSRLGFSSSLLFRETTCANFNFTSTT